MEIQIRFVKDIGVMSVKGSIDALTAPDLYKALSNQIAEGHAKLVVDLDELEYTSSAGLRALLEAVKEARNNNGDLRLASIQPNVEKVLRISGFTSILQIYPDVDPAVASFS